MTLPAQDRAERRRAAADQVDDEPREREHPDDMHDPTAKVPAGVVLVPDPWQAAVA